MPGICSLPGQRICEIVSTSSPVPVKIRVDTVDGILLWIPIVGVTSAWSSSDIVGVAAPNPAKMWHGTTSQAKSSGGLLILAQLVFPT
jgi:hypothetical protein